MCACVWERERENEIEEEGGREGSEPAYECMRALFLPPIPGVSKSIYLIIYLFIYPFIHSLIY